MEPVLHNDSVEIWGGVECTIVRINNQTHDQLEINGHEKRPDDLQLFSDLNIKTIRYPLLWEKFAAGKNEFFLLHEERLNKLRQLGIKPIAGLVHHGSGPFFTDLKDPAFPELLAEYALTIARKFPWIDYYNPINEPLTTARFSGLYGIWYPHDHDDNSFLRILLNELKGVILAMTAIRSINPKAELIQTEDICRIHSTPELKYQADFENNRRWLTYDILTGRFNQDHPLWEYFLRSGIKENELEFFIENKIDPSICGFNYYVSSERFLDHEFEKYPSSNHGGNIFQRYADVEAVRIGSQQISGFYGLLKEAWDRYKLPLALTEVHLACTREEQLRWFNEAYIAGAKLKSEGVDFRAVTAWSFLGSFDWNSLFRQKMNHYECGAFDIRSGTPRATALAGMIKSLCTGKELKNTLLEIPGWWRRSISKTYRVKEEPLAHRDLDNTKFPPVLILGATATLGRAFAKICYTRGIPHLLFNKRHVEITSKESIEAIIEEKKPWAIINTTGFAKIDEAEKVPGLCYRINTLGPKILAEICKNRGIKLVTFSTDQVFNGKKRNPYLESDITGPLNIYGKSKRKAEESIMNINPESLIIRSSSFFNPWYENDFLSQLINPESARQQPVFLVSDIIISPTYIPDLVNTTLDLLIDNESGIWHLSNQEEISYFQFGKMALKIAGMSDKNICAISSSDLNFTAERPQYSVLSSSRGILLPPLQFAIENYLTEFHQIKEK